CAHFFSHDGDYNMNISMTGKMSEVPWSHLIFHEKYRGFVDIFEGGFMHNRGVFRSEQNSCMNNDIPYYSTISREYMVRRIMKIAGEDGQFVPAETVLHGDEIILSSPAVPHPVTARYAWTDYAIVRLFGMNGLPLAPFWLE
ncbi:MAG: hypothetical protein IJJ60_08365, partial [Clostridia bacterium]|nr:hypothetical protein [Clostridia bacterium]